MAAGTWRLLPGALRQVSRNPLRSSLVVICAALGVAGAVTAVNYAAGGRAQVLEQVRMLGVDLLYISAEASRVVAGRERTGDIVTTLVEDDRRALLAELDGVVRSSALVGASLRLKAGYLSKVSPVIGVEPDWFSMKSWPLAEGRYFDDLDMRRSARVVLLGHGVAADLYREEPPVGATLFINRVPFEVIGALAERGPGLDASNEDQQVYVPLSAAMRRLLNITHYSQVVLEMRDTAALETAVDEAADLLRVRHRISRFRPDDFRVQTRRDLVEAQLAAADRLDFLVRWIGASALVVSGLGILAIAWIGVRDRIREIGIRRALGATEIDLFRQFALESVLLAVPGVLAGLGLSWLISREALVLSGLPFVFDWTMALLAVLLALVLNLLFACGPAWRAARLDPVIALRHE